MPGSRSNGTRIAALVLAFVLSGYFLAQAAFALVHFGDYGSALPQFMRYIAVPVLLACAFAFAALVLNPRRALMVGVYGVCLLLAFFIVETVLTVGVLKMRLAMLGQVSNAALQREKGHMLRGFTLHQLNILVHTDRLSQAVLSGVPGSDVLLCSPGGKPIDYTADRYGFANDDAVYTRPVDLMVVGDSFVEGFCLQPSHGLMNQFQRNGVNAVGLGIRGNGPLIEMATIGRYAPVLKPRHVVMAFFAGNDWENLVFEQKQPWLEAALAKNAEFGPPDLSPASLRDVRTALGRISDTRITMDDVMKRTALVRNFAALQLTGSSLGLIYPKVPDDMPQFSAILERAKALTEVGGGQFTLLYIPDSGRYLGALPSGFAFDQLRRKVLSAAGKAGVDVLDLVSVFRGEPDPTRFYAPNGHFSEEGARFVAGLISSRIEGEPDRRRSRPSSATLAEETHRPVPDSTAR